MRFFILFAFLFSCAFSSPLNQRAIFEWDEHRKQVPDDWTLIGPSDQEEQITLTFAVKQQNTDKLLQIFEEVSDPRHPNYGRHLTTQQVHDLLAPKPSDLQTLRSFIRSFNATPIAMTPNSDFIEVSTTIQIAEKMLQIQYYNFQHKVNKKVSVNRAPYGPYSLPLMFSKSVDFVSPTIRFPTIRAPFKIINSTSSPMALVNTPAHLRKLYSVDDTVGKAQNNSQAVTAFIGQYFHADDLAEFFRLLFSEGVGQKITTKGDEPTGLTAGTEAMLDAEYIMALGSNISTEFWGFSGKAPDNPDNEPFLKWLELVSNTTDNVVPKLFSTSYGEDEDTTTVDYSSRINIEFQKAGVRGISLLFASGDSGAAGDKQDCKNGQFVPMWPVGSPYVTGVGGTEGGDPEETAISLSSGGFSNRYPRPSWQSDAVANYLSTAANLPSTSLFNSSGRGFPDISAQATGFIVVCNLIPLPGVAGTSCASPTASGVISLLNDLRLQQGKSTLGFLNPLIYQNLDSFNDVTKGSNHGCPSHLKGFPASKGWDAVTGVGTPNYQKLAKVVLSLP